MPVHFHKDWILEELRKLKPKRVLDAGFAGGAGIEYYSEQMPEVVFEGSDRDIVNIQNFEARNSKIKVFQADAQKLPFEDNSYDVVISDALMIDYSSKKDVELMAKELQRVAKSYVLLLEQHNEVREGYAFNFEKLFPKLQFLKKVEGWSDPYWDKHGWLMLWKK